MLFRPSFCANCGEKIERAEWFPWTSRRFCQVCETEYMGQEMIARSVVAVGIIIGILGFGSYLKSGSSGSGVALDRQKQVQDPAVIGAKAPPIVVQSKVEQTNSGIGAKQEETLGSATVGNLVARQPVNRNTGSVDPVSFCGAETKKGTPCSRRVKGNTRCFQHIGMPAMAPVEKSIVRTQK